MRRFFFQLTTFVFSLLLFQQIGYATTSVWKVSKGNNHLYIGGTIHVLASSDYPLPREFDSVYSKAEIVVLEADVSKLDTPEGQAVLMARLLYPSKKYLSDKLKPETVEALKAYIESRPVEFKQVNKMKPGMLTLSLTMMELQRLNMGGVGVDLYYERKAHKDEKKVWYLESARDQINLIAKMGKGHEDAMVSFLLRDLSKLETIMKKMKDAWRSGREKVFVKDVIEPVKNDFPKVYQNILVDRNKSWIPNLEELLETETVELVLVGALHLYGEHSVLAMLKEKGYTVSQYAESKAK